MNRLLSFLFVVLAGTLTFARPAHADLCQTSSSLACNAPRPADIEGSDFWEGDFWSDLFGGGNPYGGCGRGSYDWSAESWLFVCQGWGRPTITMSSMNCNVDMFVLNDYCDSGSPASCVAASTAGGTNMESVTLDCAPYRQYYIIAQRAEGSYAFSWLPFGLGDDCAVDVDFGYRLTATCIEDNCTDRVDNDGDDLIDCLDERDCAPCFEICLDGIDNDFDNLADCFDPDCAGMPACCDKDGDGFLSATNPLCGGDDCNDDPLAGGGYIKPNAPEIPADNIDQNCDGLEDCYTDADGDFFGTAVVIPSRAFSCLAPGVSNNDDDCNDADALANPAAPEIPVNGVDNDCDGYELCHVDADRDDWGTDDLIETVDLTCSLGNVATQPGDCDDGQPQVHPGAQDDPVTGRDEDCDGFETCWTDRDGDAYGVPTTTRTTIVTCIGPGLSIRSDDCNDTPGTGTPIHPGAVEVRADTIDQNCDGFEECWIDADRDLFGNDEMRFQLSFPLDCSTPGVSLLNNDCDDANNQIHPGANDPPGDGIDQNCDNLQDCFQDNDGDGWGSAVVIPSANGSCIGVGISDKTGDCNDASNAIYPGATEVPNNGIDQNCDTFEDCYRDADADTYGSTTIVPSAVLSCVAPGVANNRDDCNDGDANVKPGAVEIAIDGVDQNCDGRELCYQDFDNDSFGRNLLVPSTSIACNSAGVSITATDCDDNNFLVKPTATEVPADRRDQNCDGQELCYTDADGDHYGVPTPLVPTTALMCNVAGVAENDDDCDDANSAVYPGAPNGPLGGVDYDCSGFATCYQDLDYDGYGSTVQVPSGDPLCQLPGMSIHNTDCNDNDQAVRPGIVDVPLDYKDGNCDGFEQCYQDLDLDGFGTPVLQPSTDLNCQAPGVSRRNDDCNDFTNTAYPGATEIPASDVDESCNGLELCYRDDDRDRYGHATRTLETPDLTCQAGTTYTDNNLDCDDAFAARNPGSMEIPSNRIDENCDGVDACYQDLDNDEWGSSVVVPGLDLTCAGPNIAQASGDCADGDATVNPVATEIPGSGIDENCDTFELCYVDADRDRYGSAATTQTQNLLCQDPGLSRTHDDCNDTPVTGVNIHPGAPETPANGIDEDCDTFENCFQDLDNDRFGSTTLVDSTSLFCVSAGVANNDDDCYDVPPLGGTVYPGAPEVFGDGVDQNCDGNETCYRDNDGDSFGGTTSGPSPVLTCIAPGFSPNNLDCNDVAGTGNNIHPNAVEIPASGRDENCNGLEDCYQDRDGDTFGTPTIVPHAMLTCLAVGVANNDDDCNDVPPGGSFIYPGAPEIPGNGVDESCDQREACYVDADGDGFGGPNTALSAVPNCAAPGLATVGGDCNDQSATSFPNAPEITGDGIDQNCDGHDNCYQDSDRDTWGSSTVIRSAGPLCTAQGEALRTGDCMDFGSSNGVLAFEVNPGATEICNDVDDDCDSLIDLADNSLQAQITWYPDGDGDGYGRTADGIATCVAPPGYVTDYDDCDDNDVAINPDADEVCDPLDVDEDCNGVANEDDQGVIDADTWHPDNDRDGYGNMDPALAVIACSQPGGHVADNTDCNDASSGARPGLPERPYDGLDNDCDPSTLDDDLDQDGFGIADDCNDVPGVGEVVNPGRREGTVGNGIDDDCDGIVDEGTDRYDDDGDGFTELTNDCNDADPSINPGKAEQENSRDDDCDGIIDEGTNRYDDDGDGFNENQGDCDDANPAVRPGGTEIPDNGIDDDCDGSVDGGTTDFDNDGYLPSGGDCDEHNATVYPNAPELPDGLDNDCDGTIDEGTERYDDDGDGHTEWGGDCNDANDAVHPDASEATNGIDDDCDGLIDEGTTNSDDDGDGLAENQGDCDDTDPDVYLGATEVANDIDDDCDGLVDEGTEDVDEDGYTVAQGDCDDLDGWANPGQIEFCDGIDNDCDEQVDEGTNCETPVIPLPEEGCCQSNSTGTRNAPWIVLGLLVAGLRRRHRAAA